MLRTCGGKLWEMKGEKRGVVKTGGGGDEERRGGGGGGGSGTRKRGRRHY